MATTNLFKTAKVLEAKATAGKKPAKSKTLIEGLELYAAIDHSIKWLTTTLATAKVAVTEAAVEKFLLDGIAAKKQPENFDAEEGKATGNIQLKKRSANSGLNDIEIELANKYGVPTAEISDRPETFIFNNSPEHSAWLAKNSDKISAFFAKLGAPEETILEQKATTKIVTTSDSIDYVFRTYAEKPEIIAQLLPVVTTLAIKPKYDAGDETANAEALEIIETFVSGDE